MKVKMNIDCEVDFELENGDEADYMAQIISMTVKDGVIATYNQTKNRIVKVNKVDYEYTIKNSIK